MPQWPVDSYTAEELLFYRIPTVTPVNTTISGSIMSSATATKVPSQPVPILPSVNTTVTLKTNVSNFSAVPACNP